MSAPNDKNTPEACICRKCRAGTLWECCCVIAPWNEQGFVGGGVAQDGFQAGGR